MAPLDPVGSTLLKAASDLLATEGAGALTVRRVANAAGVSTMNVYSRFGGKDGVVEHLFVEGFTRLADGMRAVVETDDPIADMVTCGLSYRQFAIENPTLYSVMFDRVVPDFQPSLEAQSIAGSTLELLADRIDRAMKAGVLRPADRIHTAALVWATCHGVVSLETHSVGPKTDWLVYRGVAMIVTVWHEGCGDETIRDELRMTIRLGDVTWTDLWKLSLHLIIAVPTGSCEQHGPHLPLDTDTRIATALAECWHRRSSRAMLIGPALTATPASMPLPWDPVGRRRSRRADDRRTRRSADWSSGVVLINGHGGTALLCSGPPTLVGEVDSTWWPHIHNGDAHAGETGPDDASRLTLVHMSRAKPAGPEPRTHHELRRWGSGREPNGVLGSSPGNQPRQDAVDPVDHRPGRCRRQWRS
jgi:AcrR family transcriptional regulator